METVRVDSGREVILLVEDESTLRGLVRQYLQTRDTPCSKAHSGAQLYALPAIIWPHPPAVDTMSSCRG